MQQFQSLKRVLIFYTLTLIIMLAIYYAMIYLALSDRNQQHSELVFNALVHDVSEYDTPTDEDIKKLLTNPLFKDFSYQLILRLPSGQTYVYRYTRPNEIKLDTVTFPIINKKDNDAISAYELTNRNLTGMLNLESGQQFYIVMRHQPVKIEWTSYQFWVPLMAAITLLIIGLLYMFSRLDNWEQLLTYTDNLTTAAKDAYTPQPFDETKTTFEFLRLGHALSRISYELHNKNRRIKMLSHRLERLVDRAPLPMLMIMRHGQISFFNQRFEQVFTTSFQRDTIYNLTDFVTGSDKATQQHLHKLSAQRVTRTLLVYGLADKQAYQLHITPWFGEHGQIHGFTVLFNNVNKLVTQNISLQQKNQQLQQQLSDLNKLKSVIGHELRTPLNAIIGTLDLIEPHTLSERQKGVLITLMQSSQSMLTMLNDMLDMAKIEAGKLDIVREPVDIFKLSQQVSDLMLGNARRQGIELLYFFTPDCPRYISTDSNRLRQILLNLLDNAVKFTSSGYVALIAQPISHQQMQLVVKNAVIETLTDTGDNEAEDIEFSHHDIQQLSSPINRRWLEKVTSDAQPWIHFKVQDTGIGITSTEQSQLFAYFNQANTQISSQFGGTGLGLAISSSFARLLGGFIRLSSEKDKGSTFHLYLPSRLPIYQPIYHFHVSLTHVHLIAIVNQTLSATYLQRLCDYLSIRASIYSHFDKAALALTNQSTAQPQTHAPVLLLDYEYYLNHSVEAVISSTDNEADNNGTEYDKANNQPLLLDTSSAESAAFLNDFIQSTAIPKILLSMKPERGISSALLDKFDGFLTKPLDIALLLSELIRLTQPVIKTLTSDPVNYSDPTHNAEKDPVGNALSKGQQITADNEAAIDNNNAVDEANTPLILVVEDNLTNQKITCKLLSKLGYQSVVAEDGLQAIKKLKEQRQAIALILMDCRMPVMDGLQATQAIRAQGDDITIVALTANNTDEDRDACLAVGMDDFLAKPIKKEKLQAILQQFIPP